MPLLEYVTVHAVAVPTTAFLAVTSGGHFVTTSLLGLVGFSKTGVVAGSLAAAAQSYTGNVAAGSTFAACQSLAAGGTPVLTVGLAAPIAVGTAGAYLAYKNYDHLRPIPGHVANGCKASGTAALGFAKSSFGAGKAVGGFIRSKL